MLKRGEGRAAIGQKLCLNSYLSDTHVFLPEIRLILLSLVKNYNKQKHFLTSIHVTVPTSPLKLLAETSPYPFLNPLAASLSSSSRSVSPRTAYFVNLTRPPLTSQETIMILALIKS
jgi:hypothetical protein